MHCGAMKYDLITNLMNSITTFGKVSEKAVSYQSGGSCTTSEKKAKGNSSMCHISLAEAVLHLKKS